MGKWLIVLPMLFATATATAAAAAPVWTWVDAQGQRHFSDRPVPGAQEIQVEGAQGFSAPATRSPQAPASGGEAETQPSAQGYTRFEVVSPAHQETLWNIGTVLPVQVAVEPGLQAGHRFDVYLDGSRVITGQASPQFTIPEVFRGLHTLQVAIADASGREILRTQPVTVMVQQTSVQNPNNPNN